MEKWQREFNRAVLNGEIGGPYLAQDGYYGPKTRAAVDKWKAANGRPRDGIIGPVAWSIDHHGPCRDASPCNLGPRG